MTQTQTQTRNTQPKILFVDDEEAILSSAKRIFRGKNFEIVTESSPTAALKLLEEQSFDAVVSDFRMPGMTGTELLEQIKRKYPHISRLMLTGYLEFEVIQEAINKASVFRFITKPWDEAELVLGIEAAIQHAIRQKVNFQLIQDIGVQNHQLEEFTQNLETEVFKRTQNIEESRLQAESKQRMVKELVSFVKNLSMVASVSDLYEAIHQEMWRFQGVSVLYMLVLEGSEKGKLIWTQSRTLHEKMISEIPSHFSDLSVRTASEKDRIWWQTHIKKDVMQLVAIPIRGREAATASKPLALIFAEHNLKKEKLGDFLDRITERMQVVSIVLDKILLKEQLVTATHQWEATFSAFNDPIAVVNNQEGVIRANKSFYKEGKTQCYEMLDGRTEICADCPMPTALLSMEPANNIVRTSQQKSFRVNSYPVKNYREEQDKIVRVVNHYTDVSRERELYMKLVQSEKLAAVGLLAGNIAHELNNPLSGLRAMAQVLKKELPDHNSHYQDLDEIEKAAVRCQAIIKNLLSFSESPQDNLEKLDLNEIINSTIPLLKTALRHQRLQTYFDENTSPINAEASQLQQVFFNLLNNACQAMPQGGTITIKTWNESEFSCASFSDNGPGIPIDNQERVFEPFFTTKEEGVGTGLGLSVSKNIIEKHGGKFILESEPGLGTTFIVKFPHT